ncbi:MAG: hypothetical protein ACFCU3_03065 [Verrucomicrobiales bacterium]
MVVFTVLGIIFTILLVVGGVAVAVFYFSLKKSGDLSEGLMQTWPQHQIRVKARQLAEPLVWDDPRSEQLEQELRTSGFSRPLDYELKDYEGLRMRALFHEDGARFALISEVAGSPSWVDVMANLADGEELTVSNAPSPAGLVDSRPGTRKVINQNYSASQCCRQLESEIQGRTLLEVQPENYLEMFLESIQRDKLYQLEKGACTEAEVKRISEHEGLSTEHHIEVTHELQMELWHSLSEEGVEEYLETNKLLAKDWRQLEAGGFFLPDRELTPSIKEFVLQRWCLDEELRKQLVTECQAPSDVVGWLTWAAHKAGMADQVLYYGPYTWLVAGHVFCSLTEEDDFER